ncbi:phosphoserine phosphatase SerB [Pontixanthobacter sp.]|uniref:phosphoserine phosphatase SerB n=1 Tax=Pontixanthobacter sp. TaxID=2792078 RepID=UPI003C7A94CE
MLTARLIADPAGLETHLEAALAQLRDQSMPVAMSRMLELEAPVVHLSLPDGNQVRLREVIETHFAPSAVLIAHADITVPRLFVSDMDSTMIGQECIDELADFAGLKDHVAAITERAMRGEIDFESALKERVMLLAGVPEAAIAQCLADRIRPEPGARTLVQTLKAHGCRSALVTGGFHHFADDVAVQLGFDRVTGNRLEVADGKLTGRLTGPVSDSSTKKAVLAEELGKLGGGPVLAAGDGANDIPMLQAADYGVAYKAKPAARSAASSWVDRGDLTQILSLLGIPRRDWRH